MLLKIVLNTEDDNYKVFEINSFKTEYPIPIEERYLYIDINGKHEPIIEDDLYCDPHAEDGSKDWEKIVIISNTGYELFSFINPYLEEIKEKRLKDE